MDFFLWFGDNCVELSMVKRAHYSNIHLRQFINAKKKKIQESFSQ
jgi:hypothetical protein